MRSISHAGRLGRCAGRPQSSQLNHRLGLFAKDEMGILNSSPKEKGQAV